MTPPPDPLEKWGDRMTNLEPQITRIFLVKILAEFLQILDLSRAYNMRPREYSTPGSFARRPLPLVSQSAMLREFVACRPLPCRSDKHRAALCTSSHQVPRGQGTRASGGAPCH